GVGARANSCCARSTSWSSSSIRSDRTTQRKGQTAPEVTACPWSRGTTNHCRAGARRRSWWAAPRRSSGELSLHLVDDAAERSRVVHRQLGQHLAVDVDRRFLHAGHELAVGDAELTGRGVDARDPELAKDALASAA